MTAGEDSLQRRPNAVTVFPVYRMLADGRHFYRIESPVLFTEIQIIGTRAIAHRVEAKAYPEQLRVQDMVGGHEGTYVPLDAEEWERQWALI